MNIKYLSILWMYLSCFIIGFCAPAIAEQNRKTTEPDAAATSDMDSSLQNQISGLDLTLEIAVAAALEHNPDLNVSKFNTRLAETEKLQASFFPNPELEFEYENFDEPEKTLTIGYLIETGGKRRHRMEVAVAGLELAKLEFNTARVDIIYETAAAFIDVLVAQENLRIIIDKEKLADQVYSTSRERVLSGRVFPMEQVTAEIKRSNARLELKKAEDDLVIVWTKLSAMWGGSIADFKTAVGTFYRIQPLPSFEALTAAMEHSPLIKAKLSEIKIAETMLDLEKRNRIPDFTLYGGLKRVGDIDDTIYIVGLSLPIPLFDRNQAAVQRTAAELNQHAVGLSAEKNKLIKELKIAYQTLKTAYQQVSTIKTDILPSAQKILETVKEGYREREFSFLYMLEAQSIFYESHESYVQSLEQYHHAVIALEKLLGQNLSDLN